MNWSEIPGKAGELVRHGGDGGCRTISGSLLLLPLPLPTGWPCQPFSYDCEVVQTLESQMINGIRLGQVLLENRGRTAKHLGFWTVILAGQAF